MNIHYQYLNDADKAALEKVTTFEELAGLVVKIMNRHGGKFHVVSGPITTGGVGSRDGNLRVFGAAIEHLAEVEGLRVFSQIPFEDKLGELAGEWRKCNTGYCDPILHVFYEAMFSTGQVDTLHFIHGYEDSVGAKWEHDGCEKWSIRRRYLSRELSLELLRKSFAVAS